MKARVKDTGVLIDVIPKCNTNAQHSGDNLYVCDNMVFRECDLDFLNVGNSTINWEQRRYELAKSFATGIVSSHTVEEINNSFIRNDYGYDVVADLSIKLADILIKKLKGE
jgi:hypothetical protein